MLMPPSSFKVRRVKKPSQVQPGDQVEIVTRPDGTKVRRIRRAKKPPEVATASQGSDSASLGGFLGSLGVEKKGSSATVAGDMAEGEIYVRADGIKVRRVRRTVSSSAANDDQYEIYVRPDGKKVRRIRRSALAAQQKAPDEREEQSRMELQQPSISSLLSADEAVAARASSAAIVARDDVSGGKALLAAATVQPSPQTQAPSALSPDDEDTASRYRNMLRMGTPAEADAQKMIGDGVTQNIQDSVLSSASSSTTAGAGAAAVPTNTPSKSSSLSSEDEATALHYRRMLKMGMPEGAVMQKMSVEGVARHIQDSVLARDEPTTVSRPANGTVAVTASSAIKKESTGGKVSSLSPEEEEIASMYRRMMKMGMPEGAVTQKMTVDAVSQNIQDSVIAGEIPASSHVSAEPQQKAASLSPDEEEIATTYRKMLKMGMPEGAVMQKMGVDGVAQNVQESVLAPEVPATAESPATIIRKDGFSAPDGMVLVPKEQANRIIPDGMVAVPRGQVCDGVPDGFVLVPKDRYNGDQIILMSPGESLNRNKLYSDVDISGANVVSMDDLPEQVEKLKVGDGKGQPRFLLQALPEDRSMEDDFIRKNLLPKQEVSSAVPAPPPAPAAPSSSVAEILAQMSSMGGEFDAEKMGELLAKLEAAEKRQAKLEKQLAAAGIAIGEDIDYDICVKKVEEIGKRMNAIGGSDVTHPDKEEQNRLREEYFKLEQEMEKYNSALLLTDEYQAEQDRLEKKWEEDNAPGNLEALKKLRRHMPVEVRNMSEAQLTTEPTPNGKYLPKATAKKFKRTNVLQLIRRAPDDIVRMHPSTLENMRVTGLTLTERRALYEHVRDIGPQWKAMKAEKMTERKWTWYNMMKSNFKENLSSWQRHVDQYGPPGAHPYATRANPNEGCPLIGKQCPLKADKLMDYDGDYGFTDEAVYEVSEVRKADTDDPGAKAMQEALELMKEKKANERSDALKKHYSGKLLQVSKANGSCEQMDEMMDKIEYGMMKWLEDIINLGEEKSNLAEDVKKKEAANFMDVLNDCKLSILDICGRSGMQLSGKRTDEEKPDPRSVIECSLALEVAEAFNVFCRFVTDRLKQTEVSDTRINSTIDMLQKLLKELNERNQKTIKALGGERLERSRKLKTQVDIENEIKAKQKAVEPPPSPPEEAARAAPSLPGPPRGGLMDAIKCMFSNANALPMFWCLVWHLTMNCSCSSDFCSLLSCSWTRRPWRWTRWPARCHQRRRGSGPWWKRWRWRKRRLVGSD